MPGLFSQSRGFQSSVTCFLVKKSLRNDTVNIVDFLYGLDDFLLQLDFFWIYLENLEIIVCTK